MKISNNNQLYKTNNSKESDNKEMNALKAVMVFALLLCAIVAGFAVELMVVGVNIIYWSFAERGLWLLLWTAIVYAVLYFFAKDAFNTKIDSESAEEVNSR